MKITTLLPLAALSTAFVIPDEGVMNSLSVKNIKEKFTETSQSLYNKLPSTEDVWEDLDDSLASTFGCAKHAFENAVDATWDAAVNAGSKIEETFDVDSWMQSADEELDLLEHPPHHKRPHKGPHHGPHHGKPNLTVYELISKSKYTTTLAKLINEYDDLVELLNGTTANFTVFAPTDKAFEKIPEHAPKPSKEFLKAVLTYHVSPEFYPAGRVLVTRTIPTAYHEEALGGAPQRLSTQIGLRGLTVNFYSRIVAVNIFGTNGVIHGIDSLLAPPPKAVEIIGLLPTEFSTLELGLAKTGLLKALNDSSIHEGGTIFAPSNFAFAKLGPRINAFLFSSHGEKYLKALLKYHVVSNQTLYSDAYYEADTQSGRIPKGIFHVCPSSPIPYLHLD